MTRYDATEPLLRCVLPFEAAPAEVGLLRRTAAEQLGQWGMTWVASEAELLITELATNVVKHVGESAAATLVLECRGARLRLEVHDKSREMPSARVADCGEECGRGLHLIAAMAADWGTALTAAGQAVWCELPIGAAATCGRIARAAEVLDGYRLMHTDSGLRGPAYEAGLSESAVSLISDLLHWSTARGHDPDDVLDRAQMHYEAERDAA